MKDCCLNGLGTESKQKWHSPQALKDGFSTEIMTGSKFEHKNGIWSHISHLRCERLCPPRFYGQRKCW
jgi:hypothetical protein